LRFSRTTRRASRAAASAAPSAASIELGHHLGHRASRDLAVELLHLAVDHLDARLLDSSSRI
jgi:hypothetical protein